MGSRRKGCFISNPTVAWWLAACVLPAGCTYAPPQQMIALDSAVREDGSRAIILIERHERQMPTGIAAFPSGGFPRISGRALDAYVVDLWSRSIEYQHALDLADLQLRSFNYQVLGMDDGGFYLRLSGCPPTLAVLRSGCNAERRKHYDYAGTPAGLVQVNAAPQGLERAGGFPDPHSGLSSYLSLRDGVWMVQSKQPRNRVRLFELRGNRLVEAGD